MNLKESQIIKVAIDVPVDDLFDYRCSEQVHIGQFVVVPFGSRKLIGIVVEEGANTTLPPNKIKERASGALASANTCITLLSFHWSGGGNTGPALTGPVPGPAACTINFVRIVL